MLDKDLPNNCSIVLYSKNKFVVNVAQPPAWRVWSKVKSWTLNMASRTISALNINRDLLLVLLETSGLQQFCILARAVQLTERLLRRYDQSKRGPYRQNLSYSQLMHRVTPVGQKAILEFTYDSEGAATTPW